MISAYELASTLSKVDGTRRRMAIAPSWHQGRGAFGGLLASTMLTSMVEDVNDAERIPRSLTVHFCAPAVGEVDLTTEVVRVGARVTHATARVTSEKGTSTFASASFCKDRPAAEQYVHATMPDVPAASSLGEVPNGVPGLPAFFEHIDVRFCGPTLPFSSSPSKDAQVLAWVRLREPSARPVDAPQAAFLLDTLPPAILATFGVPRALASVDFTVQLFSRFDGAAEEGAPGEHHLVAIRSRWAADGYVEELRDLWSPRGVLLAQCRQLLALL
jgi:acyl-CoA thioesterase